MDQKLNNLSPEQIAENQATFKEAFESSAAEDDARPFKMSDHRDNVTILASDTVVGEDGVRVAHVDSAQRSSSAVLASKHLDAAREKGGLREDDVQIIQKNGEQFRYSGNGTDDGSDRLMADVALNPFVGDVGEIPSDVQAQAEQLKAVPQAMTQSQMYRDILETGHVDAVAQISRNEVGLAVTILRQLILRLRDDVYEVHAKAEGQCSTGDILALYLRELMEFKGKVDAGKETDVEENKRAYFVLAVIAFFKRNYDFITSPQARHLHQTTKNRSQAARR